MFNAIYCTNSNKHKKTHSENNYISNQQKMSYTGNNTPDFWKAVTLPARVHQIHRLVNQLYGVKSSSTLYWCPGPRPTPLSRGNMKQIVSEPYLITEKSDGLRMHLVLGKYSDGTTFAVMMDNRGSAYELLVFAPRVYFDGSMFDGELVVRRGVNRWSFLVFDIVALSGASYLQENLIHRYKQLQKVFPMYVSLTDDYEEHISRGGGGGGGGSGGGVDILKQLRDKAASGMIVYANANVEQERTHAAFSSSSSFSLSSSTASSTSDGEDDCGVGSNNIQSNGSCQSIRFLVKSMLSFSKFTTLVRANQDLGHETDGFILTPVNAPVRVGTHPTCFKWKYEPSIDVRIVAHSHADIDIFVDDRGTNVLVENAMPNRIFRFQITGQCALMPGQPIIVECNVHKDKNIQNMYNLVYHRLRPDRTAPNSISTFRAVMKEVDDEITMEELEKAAQQAIF
jgi:hypothetical protein